MKKLLVNFIIIALIQGCASAFVVNPDSTPSKYAPKGYKRKGTVKYLNQGADFVIKSRREDAFKKMHTSCGGEYKITSEGERVDSDGIFVPVGGGMTGFFQSKYWYISFECEK